MRDQQTAAWAEASKSIQSLTTAFASTEVSPFRSVGDFVASELFGLPSILEENAALRAGDRTIREASASTPVRAGKRWSVQVSSSGRLNKNSRLYTPEAWENACQQAMRDSIPAGKLGGSVDHAGCFAGGNMRDRAVLWHRLEHRVDGSVWGEFSIVETSRGRDLIAWMNEGGAIAFSTYARAKGRDATDADRRQYNLDASQDATIIDSMTLVSIDAVDDPSCDAAWLTGGHRQ